jgi:hypothetical protein
VKRNTIQSIDEFYGDGYAIEHPEVLVASLNLMQDPIHFGAKNDSVRR